MFFNEIVFEIDNFLPYLYSLLFVVSIGVFKKHSSLSIIIVFLALAEFAMNELTVPLLELVSDKSNAYVIRIGMWVLTWMTVEMLIVLLLQKAHEWLNLTKGVELRIVQGAYISLMSLLLLHFVNRMLIKVPAVDLIYHFGTPIINFSIAGYLLYSVLKHMEFKWKTQS